MQVPVKAAGKKSNNTFCPFKSERITLFLSESYNDIRLAEAIVHEFHHNELYMLMETKQLIQDKYNENKFYSPWREDARPLFGLLHAIYVFNGVFDFYTKAENQSKSNKDKAQYRLRRIETYYRMRIGLIQIPADSLTTLGQSIISSITENIYNYELELDLKGKPIPSYIQEHIKKWCVRHPELASEIKSDSLLINTGD